MAVTISRRTFNRALMIGSSGQLLLPHTSASFFAETGVSMQPFAAQIQRLVLAMQSIGTPLPDAEITSFHKAFASQNDEGVAEVQRILGPRVLLEAHINPEGRVSVQRGAATAQLVQNGWCTFLI